MPVLELKSRRRSATWSLVMLFMIIIAVGFDTDRAETAEDAMSFAAFTDTHVGQQIRSPKWGYADYLDRLAQDIMDAAVPCEFVVHLGDGAYDNTAFINGIGLPKSVDPYKSNFKAFLLSHLNLPFHYVGGNIDLVDYSDEPDLPRHDDDPFAMLRTYIDETELNHYPYAMMRNGILFLALPEMAYEQWTPPYVYEWVRFMTTLYHEATTVIFSHQAIEDTTPHDGDPASTYRGKQDQAWWSALFRDNPQIRLWIHGHNHMPGWYQGNQSSGWSRPVQSFGHEMGFSAPYPQMDWANVVEEDTIVFYTISATGLTTRAWENNGAGGHWVGGADLTWKFPTTYDPRKDDWYAFPALIQDGETQVTDMKVLTSKISLQLAGTEPMELFFDPKLETKGSHVNENILGFDDDLDKIVTPRMPGMTVAGPATLTFPPKHEWDKYCHDGRGGPPYHSFSVGTISAAVPGASYTLKMTAKSKSGTGRINVTAGCSDWGAKTQYSTLSGSETRVISSAFGTEYETVSGTFVIPRDDNAWFLQGILEFADATEYDVSSFSIKRKGATDTTDDFHVSLSDRPYGVAGPLRRFETLSFPVDPVALAADDGRITFKASIGGNRYGIAQLVYHAPLLMGRDARYKVNSVKGNTFDLTLTAKLSGYSDTFKMFPFSTKYGGVEIWADDGSGENHTSKNQNRWVACAAAGGKNLRITYPTQAPADDRK